MDIVLERWTYQATRDEAVTVLPDGCRDVIIRATPGRRSTVDVSALGLQSERHRVPSRAHLTGFRLRPGVVLDRRALSDWCQHNSPEQLDADTLTRFVHIHPTIDEILQTLSTTDSPIRAARSLGVGLRTLQRILKRAHLPAPDFWRRLARARRAALALEQPGSLSDIAFAHGYADQAHLTRAFGHWFGITPHRLRARPDLLAMVAAPGYG